MPVRSNQRHASTGKHTRESGYLSDTGVFRADVCLEAIGVLSPRPGAAGAGDTPAGGVQVFALGDEFVCTGWACWASFFLIRAVWSRICESRFAPVDAPDASLSILLVECKSECACVCA